MGPGFEHSTAEDIRKVCPMEGKASIFGGEVTKLVVYTVTEHDIDTPVNFAELYKETQDEELEDDVLANLFNEDVQEGQH